MRKVKALQNKNVSRQNTIDRLTNQIIPFSETRRDLLLRMRHHQRLNSFRKKKTKIILAAANLAFGSWAGVAKVGVGHCSSSNKVWGGAELLHALTPVLYCW